MIGPEHIVYGTPWVNIRNGDTVINVFDFSDSFVISRFIACDVRKGATERLATIHVPSLRAGKFGREVKTEIRNVLVETLLALGNKVVIEEG